MLDLGIRLAAPGARTVCYVEREAYAVNILASRIQDKFLDDAPIWSDLSSFDGRPWCGAVDCIVAGFSCQPWSTVGKQLGEKDDRWVWPAIFKVVREVGAKSVFLENVPGLISGGGLPRILEDLASIRFDAEWCVLAASDVGAPHQRRRVFILAVADTCEPRLEVDKFQTLWRKDWRKYRTRTTPKFCSALFPPLPYDKDGWASVASSFSEICRMVDGDSDRMDDPKLREHRIRALGNGCVPSAVAVAWVELWNRFLNHEHNAD